MSEMLPLLMVVAVFGALLLGYPVAFVLAGVSLAFAVVGDMAGIFNLAYLNALPGSIYEVMTSDLLIAVPLFIFMGLILERAKIAEELLETMAALFGPMRGGLGISVLLVGAMLAASTGIVGATVVTMGLISLPTMLKSGYSPSLACGTICAAGTLGQIIPPSVVLILLSDQISNAWQGVQLHAGIAPPQPVSIADLFVAAIVPGLALVVLYMFWQILYGCIYPKKVPCMAKELRAEMFKDGILRRVVHAMVPPLLLIAVVLGAILGGVATATESAAVGAVGAMLLALCHKQLNLENLRNAMDGTMVMSSMVFTILIGAAVFTTVFRGYGGDVMVEEILSSLPGGLAGAMIVTMLVMFVLGFFIDFIQIIFVVVPIVAPVLLSMGADPIWLAIMMAINLQTSFLTPPFGFALFYLRGVAPAEVRTSHIYKGVMPFIGIQVAMLLLLTLMPQLATGLPKEFYGTHFTKVVLEREPEASPGAEEENNDAPSWKIDF